MPRAKRMRKTRTIKVDESVALLIDTIIKRRTASTTYADITEEWARRLYPEGLAAVDRASDDIGSALEKDEKKLAEASTDVTE